MAHWTHNPPVLRSSPSRPTLKKLQIRPCDLRECEAFVILPVSRVCGCMQPWAAKCRSLCPISAQVQDRLRVAAISVLAQRFADPALGELVLAHNALGVDPQQHVHAVPSPLRHLGRVHAAVEPRGEAGVPEVVRAPRERRGLLRRGQGRLACLDTGALVGDGRQFATPDTAEETAIRGSAPCSNSTAAASSTAPKRHRPPPGRHHTGRRVGIRQRPEGGQNNIWPGKSARWTSRATAS